jgi:hypothetical protein
MFFDQTIECVPMYSLGLAAMATANAWRPAKAITYCFRVLKSSVSRTLSLRLVCEAVTAATCKYAAGSIEQGHPLAAAKDWT